MLGHWQKLLCFLDCGPDRGVLAKKICVYSRRVSEDLFTIRKRPQAVVLRGTLIITLVVVNFVGTSLHILGMQMSILVGYTDIGILLLLADSEEVCLGVVTLIRYRLAVLALLLGAHVRPLIPSGLQLL